MATHISIHGANVINADAGGTSGAPLTIYASRADAVTFFTDDLALSRKLADAINATIAEHRAARKSEAA